jgi:membrane fusion protein, multidrug efflux system
MGLPRFPLRSSTLAATAAFALAACGVSSAKTDPPAAGGAATQGRAGDPAGGAGRGAGRGGPTITLAASDVATVIRAPLEDGTPVTGNLLPIETVQIRARLEGDVLDVLVREGEHVTQGQLLARFDTLDEASAKRSAEARLEAAKSDVATADWNASQTEELFRAGAVAERDYRAAQQSLASAKAQQAAAEEQLHAAETMFADTRVAAPTSGTVSARQVESGERVARGAALFTLVRSDLLELEANVPARRANALRTGLPVHFTADGRNFDGRVARISPTIDPATRSVKVFVDVPNAGGELKGGMFTTGRIVAQRVADALVIPTAGVRQAQGSDAPFVWRIEGRSLAQVPVELGIADEAAGLVQIVEGLAEGDRIVVGNVGTLGTNMSVQVLGDEATDAGGARGATDGGRQGSTPDSAHAPGRGGGGRGGAR